MKTLYDSEGKAKTMDFVDAREHIETGRWFAEAPVVAPANPPEDDGKLTSAQIKEKLTAAGIEFKSNASKAELQTLLDSLGG
jgi:hypothetical protein